MTREMGMAREMGMVREMEIAREMEMRGRWRWQMEMEMARECEEFAPIAFRLKLPDFSIEQSNKIQVGSKEGIITILKPSSLKTPCSELR